MNDEPDRSFRLVSYHDDQPVEKRGALIPRPKQELVVKADFHPLGAIKPKNLAPVVGTVAALVALFMLTIVGTASYGLVAENNLALAPTVTLIDPTTNTRSVLGYGPQVALTVNNFFVDARDSFIDESATFIEVDVPANIVRYFKRGVLVQTAEIESVGVPGSWWAVPAGLYQVELLEQRPYSNLAQVYLPSAIRFGGNYLIHGAPVYPDGTVAQIENSVGGIRLTDEDASMLYKAAAEGVPVLVHTAPDKPDTFRYEPSVSEVSAPNYLIADVENGTILAASELDTSASIASLTKLMTAVIAAEEIDLDTRVRVTAPTFVESLIPRLADRKSVSVYSLLQLLLVESSNEAAEVIAGQLGRDDFISLMNSKARSIGMASTVFTDPSGLDAGNISTVGDLYTLVRYISKHRSFIFEITDTTRVSVDNRGGEFGALVNFNQIEDVTNFKGGKVGETSAAGQTSISLHQLRIQGEDRLVMIVLLGSTERSEDVRSLLSYVERTFTAD